MLSLKMEIYVKFTLKIASSSTQHFGVNALCIRLVSNCGETIRIEYAAPIPDLKPRLRFQAISRKVKKD
tara:strand:+ start:7069 stop:7275 length:207 start_codon:yes stop_codon:yes gene_type:complete